MTKEAAVVSVHIHVEVELVMRWVDDETIVARLL